MRFGFLLPSAWQRFGNAAAGNHAGLDRRSAGAAEHRPSDCFLESEKDRGVFGANDMFLLAYLYCLNGSVDKAETLVADNADAIKKDQFADWLWEKLETDFGFHPPADGELISPRNLRFRERFPAQKILKKSLPDLRLSARGEIRATNALIWSFKKKFKKVKKKLVRALEI